jgi:hypothetical protein
VIGLIVAMFAALASQSTIAAGSTMLGLLGIINAYVRTGGLMARQRAGCTDPKRQLKLAALISPPLALRRRALPVSSWNCCRSGQFPI